MPLLESGFTIICLTSLSNRCTELLEIKPLEDFDVDINYTRSYIFKPFMQLNTYKKTYLQQLISKKNEIEEFLI